MPIEEEVRFVKSQIEHHAKTAAWHSSKGRFDKEARHKGLHKRFVSLLSKIKEIEKQEVSSAPTKVSSNNVGGRLGDLSDVPEHIRKQLVTVQVDELEQQILDVIGSEFGGSASIDEIMVGLWRKYKVGDKDREFLARKIYRMVRSNSVFSVPKRKGIYALNAPETIGESDTEVETTDKPKPNKQLEQLQKNIQAFSNRTAHGAG